MEHPTYLFVHGAFHGAWCWRELGNEFSRRSIPWMAIDLPSSAPGASPTTYLTDDVQMVVESCIGVGPIILVGHSYGGAVVTEAASLIPDLRALLYVAAIIPDVNQSTTECIQENGIQTALDSALIVDNGLVTVERTKAPFAFAQDCTHAEQEWLVDQLTPQTIASLRSPRTEPDADIWQRYITCEFDQAVDPGLQSKLAYKCDEVISLPSSHSPFISMPHTLADAILA